MNHFVNKNENCKCNGKKSLVRLLLEKKIFITQMKLIFGRLNFQAAT